MPDLRLKLAILASLRRQPDFSALHALPSLQTWKGRRLLLWLDQSGLTLVFLRNLQKFAAIRHISAEWRDALGQRLAQNVERSREMFEEFLRISAAFRRHGVSAAALKGFSLVPDFCEDAGLRHQLDLDFLVDPASLANAAETLRSCGYSAPRLVESGETCFTTPLRHIPSADDLYARPRQRQVDLHTSIVEKSDWLAPEVPGDGLARAQSQTLDGVEFLALSLEDKFLLQVLHAYRHSSRSWVRLSWLLEIARFLDNHGEDQALWNCVVERAGHAPLTKRIFAFVLGLVCRLFQSAIPPRIQSWTAAELTMSLQTWLNQFAVEWALSDWPGSLNNMLLAAEFIPDRKLRRQYLRSRLLPGKAQTSLGSMTAGSTAMILRFQGARLRYVSQRALVHLKSLCAFPMQQLRWKRALVASRRGPLETPS
jgi:hypothetical protein